MYCEAPSSNKNKEAETRKEQESHWKEHLASQLRTEYGIGRIVGESDAAKLLEQELRLMARSDATVLISGETGTGKSLCAQVIHYVSRRSGKPLVPMSCGAVPDELFENMLFGHERGSYTDAQVRSPGLITEANGGTLLLDDVQCLSPRTQAKILRLLESHRYLPLGATKERIADVRIISTTNEDLLKGVQVGRFRADLYYRLSVLTMHIPGLRERREDILPLSHLFVHNHAAAYDRPAPSLSTEACAKLLAYEWPGNIRELENAIHRGLLHSNGKVIQDRDVEIESATTSSPSHQTHQYHQSLQEAKKSITASFEREYIINALNECKGNITAAARQSGKHRRAFWELMRKHDLLHLQYNHER